MFNLKGKFQKITRPQEVQSGNKTFKKSFVVINFEVDSKNGKLTKQLAIELFGKPDDIDSRAKKIHDTFSMDDSVDVGFGLESKQGSKGGWFTTVRLYKIEHAAKQQNDDWDDGPKDDWNEGQSDDWEDDAPF